MLDGAQARLERWSVESFGMFDLADEAVNPVTIYKEGSKVIV